MADSMSTLSESSTRIQWMWNASENPFSKSPPDEWKAYPDIENMLIEKAFNTGQIYVVLDDYLINIKDRIEISNFDDTKQHPIKRTVGNRQDVYIRGERFTFTTIDPKRPFGGLYGWISPFIVEVAKYLNITKDQLPSKDKKFVPIIVERAADGIVEEGRVVGKPIQAAELAKKLIEKKDAEMEEVWQCCAHLYSLESFLYKKLNEAMRLIGDEEYEQVWRSKVRTLGPFCLLLWDNPSNYKPSETGMITYRGAQLSDELISDFMADCSKKEKPLRSFQAFTSCTRSQVVAEMYGNVMFIMKVKYAFTANLQPFSQYYHEEEEELLYPGVCFVTNRVEFDKATNKHHIHLDLVQQHRRK